MPGVRDGEPAAAGAAAAGRRWGLDPGHVPLVALFSLLFLVLSHLPVRGPGLWGHVIYGGWILEQRALPVEDPVLPLAAGMKVVDSAWLSQVVLAAVERAGGAEWLSRLFALTVLAAYLVLARVFYLGTGSKLLAAAGVSAVLAIGWGQATRFGPESFGALCFAGLLWLVTGGAEAGDAAPGERPASRRRNLRLWLGVPLLFALWVNLHESFVYGLAVLGCVFLGRVIDVGWRTRSVRRVLADRAVQRWLYLTELAAAATLLNPYGIDLLLSTPWLPGSGNLRSLPDWQPLVIRAGPGLSFVLSGVVLGVVLRHSRRPMPAAHVLLLAVFGAGAASGARMFIWYGPVFALVLIPHLADLADRWRPAWTRQPPAAVAALAGRRWLYLLISAMLVWAAATLSAIGMALGGWSRPGAQLFGPQMPLALAGHLAANPPQGTVFTPADWSYWLVLEGARGLQPLVAAHPRVIPQRVWRHQMRLVATSSDWQEILRRYRIDTVILERSRHQRLAGALRYEDEWAVAYEDLQALVFVRTPQAVATSDEEGERREPS